MFGNKNVIEVKSCECHNTIKESYVMSNASDGSHPSFDANSHGIWCNEYDKGGDVLNMYPGVSPQIDLSQNIASQALAYLGFVESGTGIDRDLIYDKFIGDMGHYYNVDFCAKKVKLTEIWVIWSMYTKMG